MPTIVVALGGNAIIKAKQEGTIKEQRANVAETVKHIGRIVDAGYKIAITHGNGPQVGNILLQQERGETPAMPLDVCGAMSQGMIGYLLQQELENQVDKPVITIVTQVQVDHDDTAFHHPTKPIGPFEKKPFKSDYKVIEDAGRGYRRVVASPEPVKIIESENIKRLVHMGTIVICAGGGGIPVIKKDAKLVGVNAVIDKDLTAERLATQIGAQELMMLTDVDAAYLNYGKKDQQKIREITMLQAAEYMGKSHFADGSMRPKVTAAMRFVKDGGKRALITNAKNAEKALQGKDGTVVTK